MRRCLIAVATASVVVLAALPSSAPQAAVRNPEDLLIVDCLLPGQMRKLGRMSTFMSARRPVRTTQADCEIRGGEYVSYDRANYQTALQVWLVQAEQGDAEAQNYVGEIYSKGLGTTPNYTKAAEWFAKSADQGNKRAKINLGYLYEQGLGVVQDLAKALNLYREASGASDELLFASTVTAQTQKAQAEIATLKQTVEQQRQESAALKTQVDALKRQVDERKRSLQQSNTELEKARAKLVEQQAALGKPQDAEKLHQLQAELAAQEQRLNQEREALERDRGSYQSKLVADRARLADLKQQETALNDKVASNVAAAGSAEAAAIRKDLDRVRSAASELALALDDAYGKMSGLEAQLAANEKRRAEEQAKFEDDRKKMQAALSASQQDRELLLLLEQQLSEKQREAGKQRDQIASLERQIVGTTPGGESLASLNSGPGPLLEILEPALTVTRGKPAAMVRTPNSSEVVGKVVARGGLSSLQVNGQTVAVAANGLFKANVPVAAGGSTVQIAAIDKAGTRTTLDFLLMPAPGASANSIAAPSSPSSKSLPRGVNLGRYYAVVIGNNDYTGYPKLSSAVNDAQKVADVLKRKYGFDTRLLVNATQIDTLSALNDMREALKPEDNLIVYFAGHGELDQASKQGYWLPTDAKAGNPSSWISNRAISDILNSMTAKHVLVVADSCYSGAMTRASVPAFSSGMRDNQWAEWVKTMSQSRSRTALTSGGLAPVPDSSGAGNSLFARAFITTLEDNHQLLEGQRLFREVTASLAASSTETALIQIPEYAPIQYAGHEAGEFFFQPKG